MLQVNLKELRGAISDKLQHFNEILNFLMVFHLICIFKKHSQLGLQLMVNKDHQTHMRKKFQVTNK